MCHIRSTAGRCYIREGCSGSTETGTRQHRHGVSRVQLAKSVSSRVRSCDRERLCLRGRVRESERLRGRGLPRESCRVRQRGDGWRLQEGGGLLQGDGPAYESKSTNQNATLSRLVCERVPWYACKIVAYGRAVACPRKMKSTAPARG